MPAETLPVVCLAVGDFPRADDYVARLYGMLRRHAPGPFRLLCFSDRARPALPPEVDVRTGAEDWTEVTRAGMRPTTKKLRLFDGETVPFGEFLYLDLTLVIRREMGEMLEEAFARAEDLVIVRNEGYEGYNSSVMRVRQGPTLRAVYEEFAAGRTYAQRIPGDQDFLYASLAARGKPGRVALFPDGRVINYKRARDLNRRDPAAARRRVEAATVLKFTGRPRPHQLIDPVYRVLHIRLKSLPRPAHWGDASFALRDLRRNWRA